MSQKYRYAALTVASAALITTTAYAAVPTFAASDQPTSTSGSNGINDYLNSLPAGLQTSQLALSQFNTALRDQAGVDFVGSVDDPSAKHADVYVSSSSESATVASLAAQYGVSATVKTWPLSLQAIDAASRKIMGAAPGTFGNFHVDGVNGFDPSFPGVTVVGYYDTSTAPSAQTSTSSVQGAAQTVGGVSTRVRIASPEVAADGSRQHDYAPFYAGGLMEDPNSGDICSSGFAVAINGTPSTTTARHCQSNNYEAPDLATSKYGTTRAWAARGQGRIMTASGAGWSWDGPWNSTGYDKGVTGSLDVNIGDSVCTSGGNSGVHCGAKVTTTTYYWNDGSGTEPTAQAAVSSGIAVIQGDSGGPVLIPLTDQTKIYAVGMIQYAHGTNLNPNCGGTYYTGTNICTATVGFTEIRPFVDNVPGASLVIGNP